MLALDDTMLISFGADAACQTLLKKPAWMIGAN